MFVRSKARVSHSGGLDLDLLLGLLRLCLLGQRHGKDALLEGCLDLVEVNAHPYEAIVDTAKGKGCDLIVMASHGRNGIAAIMLGSVTTKVLAHTTIPVLVCR